MTIVDNYFPFDSGPGQTATAARWRLMARLWSSTGVIPLFLSAMAPTIAGSVVTVGTGAVWIDGYYGESDSPKTVGVSGNGMVVAQMDPNARQITIKFISGQSTPTRNLNGIYEVPIVQVTGAVPRSATSACSPSKHQLLYPPGRSLITRQLDLCPLVGCFVTGSRTSEAHIPHSSMPSAQPGAVLTRHISMSPT